MKLKELLIKFNITNDYKWISNFDNFEFGDVFDDMIKNNTKILFTGKKDDTEFGLLIDTNDKVHFLNYTITGDGYSHYEVYNIDGVFIGAE